MAYYVYILECADKTFYVGYTTDIERRVREHNGTKQGARYTKTRRPVRLCYYETHPTIQQAMKREIALKRLKRERKMALVGSCEVQ